MKFFRNHVSHKVQVNINKLTVPFNVQFSAIIVLLVQFNQFLFIKYVPNKMCIFLCIQGMIKLNIKIF